MRAFDTRSLQRALALRLSLALALVATIGAAAAAGIVDRYANLAYDRALADDLSVLAGALQSASVAGADRLLVDLPPEARAWLLANEGEQVLYRVVDLRDGSVIDGNGDLGPVPAPVGPSEARAATPPRPLTATFHDRSVGGRAFRVASVYRQLGPGLWAFVQVGETLGQRRRIVEEILLGALAVFCTMGAAGVFVVWFSTRQALAPLKQLEAEASRRSSTDLRPLDPGGAPLEVRGLVVAINRLIDRLAKSIATQGRFIANAAHQLRTPLAGLHLQAELGSEGARDDATRRRFDDIGQSAMRANHLVEQLLTLARAEAGGALPRETPADLAVIARDVLAGRLEAAHARGLDFGYDGVDHARIAGHEVLLRELLANLLDNALRYLPAGGTATVTVTRAGRGVTLAVSDDGPGLPASVADHLFSRFVRGDADAGAAEGAGLGLAIVKEIADLHGAEVVHRANVPHGTVIELVFADAAAPP